MPKRNKYPKDMLPGVSYSTLNDEEVFGGSLVDLEYETMSNLSDFIEELKELLLQEKLIQPPEIMVSYLCAYLGFFVCAGLGKSKAETLEPFINNLITSQANKVYKHFSAYNIHGSKENLQAMRADSPGSIIVQTLRLGRVIWDAMEELSSNRLTVKKQTEWFCPQDSFLQLLVKEINRNIHEWENSYTTKPVLYAVNQGAMQIAWIMGYFAYMDKEEPIKYIEFGLPLVKLYGEAAERMPTA